MKKILLLLSLTIVIGFTTSLNYVLAASQSIDVTYKTYGSGNGISSGKDNKVWHYLRSGHYATLKVSSTSGAGTGQCSLYRNKVLSLDAKYGTVSVTNGSHKFSNKLDTTSGEYYLVFFGGNASSTQHIKGSITD